MTAGQRTLHEITPRVDTVCRVIDGKPADLLKPGHYPVTSICRECGSEIRCERYFRCDWVHTGNPAQGAAETARVVS